MNRILAYSYIKNSALLYVLIVYLLDIFLLFIRLFVLWKMCWQQHRKTKPQSFPGDFSFASLPLKQTYIHVYTWKYKSFSLVEFQMFICKTCFLIFAHYLSNLDSECIKSLPAQAIHILRNTQQHFINSCLQATKQKKMLVFKKKAPSI